MNKFFVYVICMILMATIVLSAESNPYANINFQNLYSCRNALYYNSTLEAGFCDINGCFGFNSIVSGTGDITAVYTGDNFISGGKAAGDVTLLWNQTTGNNTYATIIKAQNWISTNSTADRTYTDTRVNSIVNTTDSTIQGWINTNKTASDTRDTNTNASIKSYVDSNFPLSLSLPNITWSQIIDSIGNWSKDKTTLPNLSRSDVVNAVGNWTNDKSSYPLSSSLPNLSYANIVTAVGNYSAAVLTNFTPKSNCTGTDKATGFWVNGTVICVADQTAAGGFDNGSDIEVNKLLITSLLNCDTLNTTATGELVCGNDATGTGTSSGSPFTAVDNIFIYNSTGTITYNQTKGNNSIDARVTATFLQNLLNTVYASITNVQGWISTNATYDRAYTDTRVNSMNNVSATSIGAWITGNVTNANASMKVYVDAQDTLIRTSITNNITSANTSIKVYIDAQDIIKLNLSGGVMTGPINMSAKNLYNINRSCYNAGCTVYSTWNGSCFMSVTPTTSVRSGSAC